MTRCGYCDFNTYTAVELGPGASRESYAETAIAEIRLARRVLGQTTPPVETVFFGGGTPTLLPPDDLGRILAAIRSEFGLAAGAEVTTEANPESVDRRALERLRAAGLTRISFGMQSVREHVLALLDRTHTPGRPQECVAWAREAGFGHVNLDLIYGTPGESADDWRASVEAAIAAGPDHVSAYALIVEDGTRLAARVRRGELPPPDDDAMADRYLVADELLTAQGFGWYEISNWASDAGGRCRHNLVYWTGGNWWGVGPGRTAMSAAPDGGTSSIRRPTRPGWPPGAARRRPARCSTGKTDASNGSCWSFGWPAGARSAFSMSTGSARRHGRPRRGCSSSEPTKADAQC